MHPPPLPIIKIRLSTVTFQNQFNASSKDYWYTKKPARALRLLAQARTFTISSACLVADLVSIDWMDGWTG